MLRNAFKFLNDRGRGRAGWLESSISWWWWYYEHQQWEQTGTVPSNVVLRQSGLKLRWLLRCFEGIAPASTGRDWRYRSHGIWRHRACREITVKNSSANLSSPHLSAHVITSPVLSQLPQRQNTYPTIFWHNNCKIFSSEEVLSTAEGDCWGLSEGWVDIQII